MTDPAALLAGALPADPTDHGPIAVSSDAVRNVLSELLTCRELLRKPTQQPRLTNTGSAFPDGGT